MLTLSRWDGMRTRVRLDRRPAARKHHRRGRHHRNLRLRCRRRAAQAHARAVTAVYIGTLYVEDQTTGDSHAFYTLNGTIIAKRGRAGGVTNVNFLHGDHLGSITALTNGSGAVLNRQEYTPWGDVRGTQEITETALDFTGQRRDDTGLLFYNARYYDPALGRFISGDSIVPGASGGVIGLSEGKLTPLTVDFREPAFASTAGEENRLVLGKGFLDEETVHAGPSNPQALNRYSYVMNNLLKYTDPTGHQCGTSTPSDGCSSTGSAPGNGVRRASERGPSTAQRAWQGVQRFFNSLFRGGRGGNSSGFGRGTDCSFSAETVVVLAEGEEAISDVEVGDQVLAYDEATGTTGSYTVTAVMMHEDPVIVLVTIDGEQIETTPEHPFFTEERGWVPAGELRIDDRVQQAEGGTGTVTIVEEVERRQVMYNLTVAVAHTFFVGDGQWLVHNTCGTTITAQS